MSSTPIVFLIDTTDFRALAKEQDAITMEVEGFNIYPHNPHPRVIFSTKVSLSAYFTKTNEMIHVSDLYVLRTLGIESTLIAYELIRCALMMTRCMVDEVMIVSKSSQRIVYEVALTVKGQVALLNRGIKNASNSY